MRYSILLVALMVGCGGNVSEGSINRMPPDFVTRHGMALYSHGLSPQISDIEVVTDVYKEYGALASRCNDYFPFDALILNWVPADAGGAFVDDWGRTVAGYTIDSEMWIGQPSVRFGSLVHEMTHALRYACTGIADKDHSGWNEEVYPSLRQIVNDARVMALQPTTKSVADHDMDTHNCPLDN